MAKPAQREILPEEPLTPSWWETLPEGRDAQVTEYVWFQRPHTTNLTCWMPAPGFFYFHPRDGCEGPFSSAAAAERDRREMHGLSKK